MNRGKTPLRKRAAPLHEHAWGRGTLPVEMQIKDHELVEELHDMLNRLELPAARRVQH